MFVATVVQAATTGPAPTSKYHHHRQQKVSTSSSEVIQRDGWIPASHYYGSLTYLDQLREDGGSGLSGSVTMTSSGSLPSRGGFRDTLVMSSSSRGTIPAVVEPAKESKKWTFGGLFKRKSKTSSASSTTTATPIPASALPAHLTRSVKSAPNPVPKPARVIPPPVALSSELSSSDDETLAVSRAQQNQHQQQPKQNFISRQLSKRKEKKGQSGSSSKSNGNGLLKVPPPLQNGRRVGSSPDVVTTGTAPWSPWNGWEDTRRQNNSQNCSSSSMEGSLKNTRMAAREAVKARAVARRESFLCSSSSENDENDNSAQGSHSSLSSRRRLKRMSRPELVRSMSPGRDKLDGYLPPSPRWEARIVYTSQETTEQVEPVVLRLPTSAQPRKYALEDEEDEIISAGLEVPLVVPIASPYPPDDRTYANLPNPGLMYSAAPPPPPRDFKSHFYRPVSCSYLDNYAPHDSMMMMDSGYDNVGLPFMRTPAHRAPSEPKVIAKPIPRPAPQQQPVLSKMGYPVRRLADAHKLPATQSPVHMRASEFWRKKELEQGPISPSPRSFMTRIRSAGNSPVPGVKLTTATRASPKLRPTISPISNESISSLSSLSAEALTKPRNTSSPITRSPLTATQRTIARPTTLNLINSAPKTGLSACERLKVKLPSSRASPAPEESTVAAIKTSGKNLEDALNELEDMYKSLRLSDEDLLDRAERRDLPTVHQQLRSRSPIGSIDNLDTASIISTPSSARGSCFGSQNALQQRNRAPPLRRSGRPDTVNDDMAKRRFDSPEVKPNDPRSIVGKSGSYMVFSPAFSPPSTPPPFDPLAYDDPDLQADDVSYRNYKRANSIRIIEAPPPFGIPLAPGAPAPDSDYLHAQPKENFRPLFRHSKRPDLVKDDIAFRSLRKDLGGQEPLNRTDWTPKLFPNKSDAQPGDLTRSSIKKLRAVRSLSANISHLIPFKDSRVSAEIGKWNSYSDLTPFKSALNYMEPSWVDQVEAVATKETLAANERVMRKMKSPVPLQLDRRPWTDVLLESFEKEKAEIERLNQEAEDALSQLDKREAGDGQEDAQVYQESSTDELKSKDFQEPNPSDDVIDSTPSDSPKIQGTETDPVTSQQPEPPVPKKRTTLSISPQQSDEAAESNKSPTTLFTPPRKVHQIQLDSFHVIQEEKAAAAAAAEELKKSSKDSELNELIDALVRDADTCGPSKDETSSAAASSNCNKSDDCKNSQGGGSSKEKCITKSNIQVAGFVAHISVEGRESNEGQSEPQSPKLVTSSSDEVGKDKSSKRKSYLNRSLTDEPLPLFNGVEDEKQRRRSRCSSRPLSQDVTSLLATTPISKGSSSEDTRAVIVKAPQIPAIFQNSVDNKLIKEPPSSTRRASAITAKIKVFEAEDSKELKAPQAEGGMSSIKRLLQKESKQQPLGERKAETLRRFETPIPTSSTEGPTFFTVKRSPSAGSNFNMSKVTNSQPSFLRKFFEKPLAEQQQQKKQKDAEDEQKDQNDKDYEEEKTKEKSKTEEDPVLGLSVVEKATLFMKLEHEQRFSKWRKGTPTELPSGFQSPVDKVMDQPSVNKSSFPSHDRYPSTAPTPINLRDRRSVFEPSRPPSCRGPCESSSYPRQTPIRTPFDPADRRSVMEEFSTPIGWLPPDPSYFFSYPSNVYSPSVQMARRRGSISDADLNCAMRQMGPAGYPGFPPPPPPYPFKCIPPHHHPPPPPPFFHPKQPQPPQVRGYRVRSLFVSGTSDHETHSEDGEVSSGGQEVAEIISKSYENSPVFRKKSWRSQKKVQQKVLTKEVWRRCSQQQDDTDVNDVFYDARSEFEDFDKEKQHLPPPATSNLLPILTALSSSNDELDDGNNLKTNKPKISRKTLSSSVSCQKTEVTVPQADDESFRAFFQHPRFPPLCPPQPQASKEKTLPADYDASNNNNDFSSVKREADMLVMKKHVPLVRRKSSGKSKNPLKALAARFDFTNQKYTEVHTSQQ